MVVEAVRLGVEPDRSTPRERARDLGDLVERPDPANHGPRVDRKEHCLRNLREADLAL
jgi:hypothetical protein